VIRVRAIGPKPALEIKLPLRPYRPAADALDESDHFVRRDLADFVRREQGLGMHTAGVTHMRFARVVIDIDAACQWRRAKGPFFCPIFRWFFAEPFSLVSVSQNGPRRQGSASPRPITARP
jgi:hypothetical protein